MDPLSQGLQLVNAAVEADSLQDYAKAIHLYEQSLNHLFLAAQQEQDPGKKNLIDTKVQEYLQRLNFLRQIAQQQQQQQHQQQQQQQQQPPQQPQHAFPPQHLSPQYPSQQVFPPQHSSPQQPSPHTQPQVQNSPSSPTSQEPDFLPIIAEFAYKHPAETKDLGAALELSREAQKQDQGQNFQAALDLYVDVVDRLRLIREGSDSENMKKSLSETMASYLTRAEQIKAAYPNLNPRLRPQNPAPPNPNPPTLQHSQSFGNPAPAFHNQPMGHPNHQSYDSRSMTTYDGMLNDQGNAPLPTSPFDLPSAGNRAIPSMSVASSSDDEFVKQMHDSDRRVLPVSAGQRGGTGDAEGGREIRVENTRVGNLDRKPMYLTAKMSDNLVKTEQRVRIYVEVRNQSSTSVKCLKLKLRRIVKNLKTESSGKNTLKVEKEDIKSIEYYQGAVFPLPAEADYKGYVEFDIPKGVMETNVEHKGYFEREYEFKLECVITLHRNLPVYIPIVVKN